MPINWGLSCIPNHLLNKGRASLSINWKIHLTWDWSKYRIWALHFKTLKDRSSWWSGEDKKHWQINLLLLVQNHNINNDFSIFNNMWWFFSALESEKNHHICLFIYIINNCFPVSLSYRKINHFTQWRSVGISKTSCLNYQSSIRFPVTCGFREEPRLLDLQPAA